MRAVAVLLVMAYHAIGTPSAGFAGVDVFFVVSGFVITTQLVRELERGDRLSLLVFYGRRAKRLLPAAALVILVTASGTWLLAPESQWRPIATDLVGASAYFVNWVFAVRSVDYLAEDVDPSPVLHFWSLAVEEQFYVVWPLIILLLIWLGRRLHGAGVPSRRLLAIGLALLVIAPSFAWALHLTSAEPAPAFYVTTTRLWELAAGALVALGAGVWQRFHPVLAAGLGWVGVVTVIAGAFLQDGLTPWPGPGAVVPVLGTAAVIVGGFAAGRLGPVVLLGTGPLVWIGGLSYSLYLWHWPVLVMAGWRFGELSTTASLVVVLASVVPAQLSYLLVERPIRYSARLTASPATALSVGANLSLAGVVSGLVLAVLALTAAGGSAGGGATSGTVSDDDGSPEPPGVEAFSLPPVYDVLTPAPLQARDDRPDAYDKGCQVAPADPVPVRCESGDPDGDLVVAVVGDSKMLQWITAIDTMAEDQGWSVVSYTKSGCSPSTATVYDDEGRLFESCMQWSRSVLDDLASDPPDVYITSGRRFFAGPDFESVTPEHLAEGYADAWRRMADVGATVVAISDSPGPELQGMQAYECVLEHPGTAEDDCSWPYQQSESSKVLKSAVGQVPGATFVDMDPWICPAGTCPTVFRNILTYRQGSHLTMTYVHYLTPALAAQLVPLVEEATS